jgi:hypothetical protein
MSQSDVLLRSGPHAQLWSHLLETRPVVRPIAATVKRILALAASEAHCERVIKVLRRMLCPFSFRMTEEVIMARISARSQ